MNVINSKLTRRLAFTAMAATFLCLMSGRLLAEDFPNKPIKIIASYPPGGGTDLMARLIAEKLQSKWGQPVIVDNRAGGMGIIGARAAAGAKPDGYTLYIGSSDHMVLLPIQYENLPFDPLKDFVAVAPVANQYEAIVVHPSVPASSVKELIAIAKSKPGQLTFASQGTAAIGHLSGELFQAKTGTNMTHVPYKGTAPAITDLIGGQGPMVMFAMMATIAPHIKAGKIKALAITAPQRSTVFPNVPTAAEAGLPNFVLAAWNGIFAPAGTPKDIVNKLNNEIRNILQMPSTIERLTAVGLEPAIATPAEFSALIKADQQKWGEIVTDAGIKKQPL
jgi:tripartite-type tricarboxylate transporter receptor subunit TctC